MGARFKDYPFPTRNEQKQLVRRTYSEIKLSQSVAEVHFTCEMRIVTHLDRWTPNGAA